MKLLILNNLYVQMYIVVFMEFRKLFTNLSLNMKQNVLTLALFLFVNIGKKKSL